MHFLIIQGLMGKLQAYKERINKTQEDVVPNTFFKTRWLYIYTQGLENVDKKEEKKTDLKKKIVTTSTGQ